jgi:hypothetical protein
VYHFIGDTRQAQWGIYTSTNIQSEYRWLIGSYHYIAEEILSLVDGSSAQLVKALPNVVASLALRLAYISAMQQYNAYEMSVDQNGAYGVELHRRKVAE